MGRHLLWEAAATVLVAAFFATSSQACIPLAAPPSVVNGVARGVTVDDLISLRDVGPATTESVRTGIFSLSPDRTHVAFQIRQADAENNRYCLGMFVMETGPNASPIMIDEGGEFLGISASGWNIAELPPPGIALTITPSWSPDGRSIAYLRRDQGSTQVWRARVDGSSAEPISRLAFDVEGFGWMSDGTAVVVKGRPGLKRFAHEMELEGLSGHHFDDRILPNVSARPVAQEPIATEYFVVPVDAGEVRMASASEAKLADPPTGGISIPDANLIMVGENGQVAWTAPQTVDDISAPSVLHIKYGAWKASCASDVCQGIADGWFDDADRSFIYLSRPRGVGAQTFYRWSWRAPAPVPILQTDNLYSSCRLSLGGLICGEEEADKPRRLVELDLHTLRQRVIFDPNPGFGSLVKGKVQRLHWINAYGVETYGDLVLPPNHRVGDTHPLIVVGYATRGFLRGGTGDEYPIFALANAGYAVLSYSAPKDIGFTKGAKTWAELERINRIDWLNFRSSASSVETGIDEVVKLGVADPSRIGLTGLSFGASIAQFELVNSRRYAAAILSTCCEEESNASMLAGLGFAKVVRAMGYPGPLDDGATFWQPMSFRLNARIMSTPTLLQVADREFLGTTESVTALTEAGQPIDEYIFPDETHTKWQPSHRLAIYRRNIQWFDFWLRQVEAADPVSPNQYSIWRALRASGVEPSVNPKGR